MRKFILYITFLISGSIQCQITFDKTKVDFGELTMLSERFADIKLTNIGPKKGYILTVKKPGEVVYIVSGQFIEKDSSITVRLQVNPTKKGRFTYEVSIFTSDKAEATIIKLTGNLKEFSVETNAFLQACPDFNTKLKDKNSNDFVLTVLTIDKQTKAILAESSVTMIQNGRPTDAFITNQKGTFTKKFPLGFTYFYATHNGYLPAEMGAYVNFQRNTIVIELTKNPDIILPPPNQNEKVNDTIIPEHEVVVNLENELANEQATPISETKSLAFDELDKNNFDASLFKPVNLVFVLDVSASMKAGEKLELMKYSLYQLIAILRPQDKITIVTYSSNAIVLMETMRGDQKEEIIAKVEGIKAEGFTAGGEGIKLGYKEALKNYLNDGVNQIVIITDGAFNRNSGDYKKVIKKYKKKGVNMSVVGIQNSEKDKINMVEVADLGGGRYVPIFKLVDAQNNLKQEMRFIAFKK
ncbi:MAG: VWA domain-containing protein [Flavobacteriia bacterium]|nr:VWA domain-containing protein [Flavobacteriia bacterium]